MKRILLLLFSLVILCVAAIYIFIPAKISILVTSQAACIPANVSVSLQDQPAWNKWWPQHAVASSAPFTHNNYQYHLINPYTDGAEIQLSHAGHELTTRLFVIPSAKDSSTIEWHAALTPGLNPIKRLTAFFEAKKVTNDLSDVLKNLVSFAEKTENIYGFHIMRTTFTDTILAALKFSTEREPTPADIYGAIARLKKKIRDEAAEEKDYPMLNVNEIENGHFETMIAICVNKNIRNEGGFFTSRMVPMKDRFLMTEVTGGPVTLKNAHKAIETYMNDRFLSAPAIPFEVLVTDRLKQTDTSKWKTIIFHPSM